MRTMLLVGILGLSVATAAQETAHAKDTAGGQGAVSAEDATRLRPDVARVHKASDSGSHFDVFVADPDATGGTLEPDRWLMLTGTGVREKLWFNVYTVGLYLDPLASHHLLSTFRGRDGKAISKDNASYAALAKDELPRMLRLVMNRDVDTADMREAFDDSLEPRIRKAALKKDEPRGLKALAAFRELFSSSTTKDARGNKVTTGYKELAEGTELLFHFRPGGRLDVAITHHKKSGGTSTSVTQNASFSEPLLSDALIDVYLGRDPVSNAAKTAFATGLPGVLERGAELAEAGYPWPRPVPEGVGSDEDEARRKD